MSNDTPPWVANIFAELRSLRHAIERSNQRPTQQQQQPQQQQPSRRINASNSNQQPVRRLSLHIDGHNVEVNACWHHHRYGAATTHKCRPKCDAAIEFKKLLKRLNAAPPPADVNHVHSRIRTERGPPQLSDSSSSDSESSVDNGKN